MQDSGLQNEIKEEFDMSAHTRLVIIKNGDSFCVIIGQATDDLLHERYAFLKAVSLIDEARKADRLSPGSHIAPDLPGAKQLANRLKQLAGIIEPLEVLIIEIEPSSKQVFQLSKKGKRSKTGKKQAFGPVMVAMIIDASGSMQKLASSVIGNFEQWRARQLSTDPDTVLDLTFFNDQAATVYPNTNLQDVPSIVNIYRPDGNTALYQAMGETTEGVIATHKEATVKPAKVVIITMTDGHENASRGKYAGPEGLKKLFDLINTAKTLGFEFIFIGATPDTFDVARSMGIDPSHTSVVGATREGMGKAFDTMTGFTTAGLRPPDENKRN